MDSMMGDPGWGYPLWPVVTVALLLTAVVAGMSLLRAAGDPHPPVGPIAANALAGGDTCGGALLVTDPAAPGELRASDAEREHVAAALSGHLAAGRLSVTEFEERITAAYAAHTLGQLRTELADLPLLAR